MKQFDLSVWLIDKSRKVVTRRGNPVRIVCWDAKGLFPILALLEGDGKMDTKKGDEYPCSYRIDGTCPVTESYDLFFADEEEELTEFEKEVDAIIREDIKRNIGLKYEARNLLNLARMELKNNDWRQSLRSYKDTYEQGKQDALKDLPKWKHLDNGAQGVGEEIYLVRTSYDHYFTTSAIAGECDYLILTDLEKLPKS